ncbi:HNH endonuclease [Mucilaginibacter galii]
MYPRLETANSWSAVVKAAQNAMEHNLKWKSPIRGYVYRVSGVYRNHIEVFRSSTKTVAKLSNKSVRNAVLRLNSSAGMVARTKLLDNVAWESAVTFLHPDLYWSDDFSQIYVKHLSLSIFRQEIGGVLRAITEADDDDGQIQQFARLVRRGQKKLREILLIQYQERCSITGVGPSYVLEAAHIEPHAVQGINESTNAFLLRADIHTLFDLDMLAIHPENLTVFVHPKLESTVYQDLAGRKILPRIDGQQPDTERLLSRWLEYNWI